MWYSRILLIWFSTAALINYHTFSGLKQYPFIILQLWKSEVQNQFLQVKIKVLGELHSSGGPRGESFSLPLPAPTGCLHSLARGTSLHLQVNSSAFTLLWPLPPSSHLLWFWSSFFLLRVLCCTAAAAAAAAAKSLQSCPTLCDPIDSGPPGSPSLGCMDPP